MESLPDRLSRGLVYCFILAFTLAPLLLVLSLSFQVEPPYKLWPSHMALDAYRDVWRNSRGILSSIGYSILACGFGTIVGLLFALAAVYLLIGEAILRVFERRAREKATLSLV